MKKLSFLILLSLNFSLAVSAQIAPPDFLCVKGDTLFWDLPVNNCGPFNSYDIFASQDMNGPYALLTTITDPAKNFFVHSNPSGAQWFYYLQSNYDCPGEIPLQSDTLDNFSPEVSPIISASVEGGNVLLNWAYSPSPEVFAYIIYREMPLGFVPIDTVFGENTYTDLTAEPAIQPESYFVNALDRCGNTSIFDVKHTTLFVEGRSDSCEQSIVLNWNLYESWTNGIGEHEIWVGVNGATPSYYETIGVTDTYSYTDVNDGDNYCFVVHAIEEVTGAVAKSNELCLTADIVQPVNGLYLQNVSVVSGDEVEITWGWNTNAAVQEVTVQRSGQNGNYQTVFEDLPVFPLVALETYQDNSATPADNPVFYRIETVDDCGKTATSNYGSTIHLQGISSSDNTNLITWTPFDIENAALSRFELFKIVDGNAAGIATLNAGDLQFSDEFEPTNLAEAQACYYIVAHANVTRPDGNMVPVQSRSNVSCIEQEVRILTPNAFVPDGVNFEFKPLVVLGDIDRYEMSIYDRYGQKLFTSLDPDEGWRGKKDGRKFPQGVYVYHIKIIQNSGHIAEKRGPVLLLH